LLGLEQGDQKGLSKIVSRVRPFT